MKMSMADNIKSGIKKKKQGFNSEQELRDLINSAASKSLKQFIQRLEAGEIPIDNISDFIRVIGAYKEINGIAEVLDGNAGQSALPEINMRQDKVLEDTVQKGKISKNEEDRVDIMDLSAEDVADLIREMDIAQNKENEGAF
jgi:hypothetical protein